MLRNDMITLMEKHGIESGQEIIKQMIRRESKTVRIYSERRLEEAVEMVECQNR